MHRPPPVPLREFLQELAIYSPLVALYLLFMFTWVDPVVAYVAHFRQAWVYALLALCLMMAQSLGLEILTGWLVKLFSRRRPR